MDRFFDETNDDLTQDTELRPSFLGEFIGQGQLKSNLEIFISSAKSRKDNLDHVLFYGPPGLGKTTLSQIIAKELGVNIKMSSGPVLSKTGEIAAILTNLSEGDVFFIDEIHRLNTAVEELLYSAMEDFSIDIVIGDGPAARTVKINLPKFTLVGATTRLGLLTGPLRDRFGIPLKLNFYSHEELQQVIIRAAKILNLSVSQDAAKKIAICSRGTPRISIRLLKRVRDFAEFGKNKEIDVEIVQTSLKNLGIDETGLDPLDYAYVKYIAENYSGGPVGIDTISAGLSEDRTTIEDMIEPYLMQIGFVGRTPRGRVLTDTCLGYFNYAKLMPKLDL